MATVVGIEPICKIGWISNVKVTPISRKHKLNSSSMNMTANTTVLAPV